MTDNNLISKYKTEIYNSKTGEYDKLFLEIYIDETPNDPREWDNLTYMHFISKEYRIGDREDQRDYTYLDIWNDLETEIRENNNILYISPISLHDYGCNGLKLWLENDNDCNGMVGFIYITEERLKEMCGVAPEYQEIKWLEDQVKGELKEYNQYFQGDVYGFETYKLETCKCCNTELKKEIESVWGFYGHDFIENGLFFDACWNKYRLNEVKIN